LLLLLRYNGLPGAHTFLILCIPVSLNPTQSVCQYYLTKQAANLDSLFFFFEYIRPLPVVIISMNKRSEVDSAAALQWSGRAHVFYAGSNQSLTAAVLEVFFQNKIVVYLIIGPSTD